MPDFPLLVTHEEARRETWGGGDSGFTRDWVYVLDDELCLIVFGLGDRGWFTQAEGGFDVYERDTVWYVLSGDFVAANPQTGEVHRLTGGDSLVFRGDVWHHGFTAGPEPVLVAELTAPPPTRPERLVRRQALPERPRYAEDASPYDGPPSARIVRASGRRWVLAGAPPPLFLGEIASTRSLTVGVLELPPGQRTDILRAESASALYVEAGSLGVEFTTRATWLEAGARDAVLLPAGEEHRLAALGRAPCTVLYQRVA